MSNAAAPQPPSLQPLYVQVQALLLRSLEAERWRPGQSIPSAVELATQFGVSQGTVRKAIDGLVANHILIRRQGKGTFVATHTEEKGSLFRFLRVRRDDGVDEYPVSRLIDVRRGKASGDVTRALELKSGEQMVVVRRVLEYGKTPVLLDEIALPSNRFKGLTRAKVEAYAGSMYGFFESQFGVRMLDAEERLKAVAADAPTAALLRVRPGEPLLAVERIARTYGGRPIELRRGLCTTKHHYYLNNLR